MSNEEKKEYLNGYRYACRHIHNLQEQLQALIDTEQSAKIQQLSDMPKVGEWIPCSERLPECELGYETNALLFQLKDTGTIHTGYYGRGGKLRDSYFRTYFNSENGWDARDVAAWMPLPEYWKEDTYGE